MKGRAKGFAQASGKHGRSRALKKRSERSVKWQARQRKKARAR